MPFLVFCASGFLGLSSFFSSVASLYVLLSQSTSLCHSASLVFFSRVFFLLPLSVFFLLWSSLPGLLVFPFAVFALSSSSSLAPRYPDTVSSSLADNVFISKSVDVVNNSHFTYRPIVFCRKVKTFNQKQLFGLVGCI